MIEALTSEALTNLKKPLTKDHWTNILSLGDYEAEKRFELNDEFTLEQLLNVKLHE